MGAFDSIDWGSPDAMAQMGILQALGAGSMPSRLPVPMGAVFGQMFNGAEQGAQAAQAYKQSQISTEQAQLGLQQTLSAMNYYRGKAGMQPLTMKDLQSGKYSLDTGSNTGQTDPAGPGNFVGAPMGGAPSLPSDPAALVSSVRTVESNNNPKAVSPKGATGPMQLMPATAANPGFGIAPAKDNSTAENDRVGQQYLGGLTQKYGNATLAAIAYNWGPGNTDKWIAAGADPAKLPAETQAYLGKTLVTALRSGANATQISGSSTQQSPSGAASPSPLDGINQIGLFNPQAAMSVQEDWMKPQNMRQGSDLAGLDPATGQIRTYLRNPVLGQGQTMDDSGVISMLPGAVGAIQQTEGAKRSAELPYDIAESRAKASIGNYFDTGGAGLGTPDGGIRSGAVPAAPVSPAGNGPTSSNAPIKTAQGTLLPPVSQAAPINPSGDYLKARIPQWAETENDWNDALPSGVIAEQRALAIADALKQVQSGAYTTDLAGFNARFKAITGSNLPGDYARDPAAVEEVLKNNFQSTLNQIRAFSSRPAAIEVQLASKNFANPDLQPAANLQIIGETVGTLRWERAMLNDWAQAKGQGWQDPQDFQRAWTKINPIQNFIDGAEKQIGPLKGMNAPPPKGAGGLPAAAVQSLKSGVVSHFRNGQSWTLGPNGQPLQVN